MGPAAHPSPLASSSAFSRRIGSRRECPAQGRPPGCKESAANQAGRTQGSRQLRSASRGLARASRWPGCALWPSGAAPRCCCCAGTPLPTRTCPRMQARKGTPAVARAAAGLDPGARSSGRAVAACSWPGDPALVARNLAGSAAPWRLRQATVARATAPAAGHSPEVRYRCPGRSPAEPVPWKAGSG